jgi:hypothetical protein
MSTRFPSAAAALAVALALPFAMPAFAGQPEPAASPTFATQGFPLALHQAQVLGLADMEEQPQAPQPQWRDMPASPHQVAVLEPRPLLARQMIEQLERAGYSDVSIALPSQLTINATRNGRPVTLVVETRTVRPR